VATNIAAGAEEIVASGGVTDAARISGGVETIEAGGLASGATLSNGGLAYVYGLAISATTLKGGSLVIESGGVGSAATLSGGKANVEAGGVARGIAVSSAGVANVYGVTSGDMVSTGGQEIVRSGGVASGATVSGGGVEYVYAGGSESGTQVVGGGVDALVGLASASGTVVSAAGKEDVEGGVATGTTLLSGATQYVFATATASGTVVDSGGEAHVRSGALAASAVIFSGGGLVISAGGTASGLTLLSGGELTDDGTVAFSGFSGAQTLAGILQGTGTIVETGGADLRLSGNGGRFAGHAVISGGTIELAAAHALGGGDVTFVEPAAGSAVLQIDAADAPAAGGTFADTISNFNGANEAIDLPSIAFASGASATVAGHTLVLTDGGKTYSFDLAGAVAGAYPVLSDGHGGTLIDPRVALFAQTAAALAPSTAAGTPLVSSASTIGQSPLLYATASAGAGHG
jgi:autotransporter passenger strand-loop-strand repeat protein